MGTSVSAQEEMGGGWICGTLALLIVGAASKILPMHHSDIMELSDEEEDTTIELVENDGFEIFGGFGYSNSLADIGVPVVYKEAINLQVVEDNESEGEERVNAEYYDTEKENNIGTETIENEEIASNDIVKYKEKVDELEVNDEDLRQEESQTIDIKRTNSDIDSEYNLLEKNIEASQENRIEEHKANIEENVIELNTVDDGDAEIKTESESLPFDPPTAIEIDSADAIDKTEVESGISGFHLESTSEVAIHAEARLDVLIEEEEEMEVNEEVVVIHKKEEIYVSHSVASSNFCKANQLMLLFFSVFFSF